jgi:hypothetical protein
MSFRNRQYEGSGAEHCDRSNEFDRASVRFVSNISSVGGTLLMVLAIAAGSIGSTSFASFVARQDQLAASGKDPLDAIHSFGGDPHLSATDVDRAGETPDKATALTNSRRFAPQP